MQDTEETQMNYCGDCKYWTSNPYILENTGFGVCGNDSRHAPYRRCDRHIAGEACKAFEMLPDDVLGWHSQGTDQALAVALLELQQATRRQAD